MTFLPGWNTGIPYFIGWLPFGVGGDLSHTAMQRVLLGRGIECLIPENPGEPIQLRTNFPITSWHATVDGAGNPITPVDVTPSHVTNSAGIQIGYDDVTGAAVLSTSFQVPSLELYWSAWTTRVTVATADTSKTVATIAFTDAGRANQTWAIRVEYECIMRRVSDPTQPTCLFNSTLVTAVYNSSGVPTLTTTSEGSSKPFQKWQGGGVPVITGFSAGASGANIVVAVSKDAGGIDCYAKCRVRKCTEYQVDNW